MQIGPQKVQFVLYIRMQIATFGIQNGEHKNCRWSEKESSDYITQKRQSELFAVKNTFGM